MRDDIGSSVLETGLLETLKAWEDMTKPYLTAPASDRMPKGIPYIIGNEAVERFSFYGMKGILTIFMTKYLFLLSDTAGTPMPREQAVAQYHDFTSLVYFTPVMGAC